MPSTMILIGSMPRSLLRYVEGDRVWRIPQALGEGPVLHRKVATLTVIVNAFLPLLRPIRAPVFRRARAYSGPVVDVALRRGLPLRESKSDGTRPRGRQDRRAGLLQNVCERWDGLRKQYCLGGQLRGDARTLKRECPNTKQLVRVRPEVREDRVGRSHPAGPLGRECRRLEARVRHSQRWRRSCSQQAGCDGEPSVAAV